MGYDLSYLSRLFFTVYTANIHNFSFSHRILEDNYLSISPSPKFPNSPRHKQVFSLRKPAKNSWKGDDAYETKVFLL